jgi:hypothetical protein
MNIAKLAIDDSPEDKPSVPKVYSLPGGIAVNKTPFS